jgi:hypothetical protein
MVMTKAGAEFNLQSVLRIEEEFMLVRGRIAGSNDGGRIFLLSFAQIDHMGFQRPVSDDILNTIFAPGAIPAAVPIPTSAPVSTPAQAATPPAQPSAPTVAETTADPQTPPPPKPGVRKLLPSRSRIIERLRLRTTGRDNNDSSPAAQ